jgi:hypothetical protein
LLLQMQGMIAKYERAKIRQRHRRGKLHGARRGSVNVLGAAPYGYRYTRKGRDGEPVQYLIDLEQAKTVRQIFDWVGIDRVSIGEVVPVLVAHQMLAPVQHMLERHVKPFGAGHDLKDSPGANLRASLQGRR